MHGTNWWWMLFSLLFGVLAQVFRGWRWRQTLEPLDAFPKRSDCVNAIFVSYAASLVIPRIGEVSRCGILAKYDNVSFAKSLGTVVTERLVDTLTILLITGVTVLLQMPVFVTFLQQTGTKIPSLLHLLTSVWFYIVLFCFIGVGVLLYYLRKTLFFYEKVKGFVLNIWEGIMSLKGVRNIPPLYFLYISHLGMLLFPFLFYILLLRFHRPPGHDGGIGHVCSRYIRRNCTYSQRAGPWHFAIISMMMFYGVNEVDAGVFALIVHGIQTLLVVFAGYLWLCRFAVYE